MGRRMGLLLVLVIAWPVSAQIDEPFRDEVPLADLLEIVILERQLLAVDATGGDAATELHLGERVHWKGTRGRVGVVLTASSTDSNFAYTMEMIPFVLKLIAVTFMARQTWLTEHGIMSRWSVKVMAHLISTKPNSMWMACWKVQPHHWMNQSTH